MKQNDIIQFDGLKTIITRLIVCPNCSNDLVKFVHEHDTNREYCICNSCQSIFKCLEEEE